MAKAGSSSSLLGCLEGASKGESTRCRRARGSENVVKITDTENQESEIRREEFLLNEREVPGLSSKQSDLVTAEVKPDIGTNV